MANVGGSSNSSNGTSAADHLGSPPPVGFSVDPGGEKTELETGPGANDDEDAVSNAAVRLFAFSVLRCTDGVGEEGGV